MTPHTNLIDKWIRNKQTKELFRIVTQNSLTDLLWIKSIRPVGKYYMIDSNELNNLYEFDEVAQILYGTKI